MNKDDIKNKLNNLMQEEEIISIPDIGYVYPSKYKLVMSYVDPSEDTNRGEAVLGTFSRAGELDYILRNIVEKYDDTSYELTCNRTGLTLRFNTIPEKRKIKEFAKELIEKMKVLDTKAIQLSNATRLYFKDPVDFIQSVIKQDLCVVQRDLRLEKISLEKIKIYEDEIYVGKNIVFNLEGSNLLNNRIYLCNATYNKYMYVDNISFGEIDILDDDEDNEY